MCLVSRHEVPTSFWVCAVGNLAQAHESRSWEGEVPEEEAASLEDGGCDVKVDSWGRRVTVVLY